MTMNDNQMTLQKLMDKIDQLQKFANERGISLDVNDPYCDFIDDECVIGFIGFQTKTTQIAV